MLRISIVYYFLIIKLCKLVNLNQANTYLQRNLKLSNIQSNTLTLTCDANCIQCSNNQCLKCRKGTVMDITTHSCLNCPCKECIIDSNWAQKLQCKVNNKDHGYFFQNTNQISNLQQCSQFCETCISSTNCQKCQPGSYLFKNANNEIFCKPCQSNCIDCFFGNINTDMVLQLQEITQSNNFANFSNFIVGYQEYCTECNSNFALQLQTFTCQSCQSITNCNTCSYSRNNDKYRFTNIKTYNQDFLKKIQTVINQIKSESYTLICLTCLTNANYALYPDLQSCIQCGIGCTKCAFGTQTINTADQIAQFPISPVPQDYIMRCYSCNQKMMISADLTKCVDCPFYIPQCQSCQIQAINGNYIHTGNGIKLQYDNVQNRNDPVQQGNILNVYNYKATCQSCQNLYGLQFDSQACNQCTKTNCQTCKFDAQNNEKCYGCFQSIENIYLDTINGECKLKTAQTSYIPNQSYCSPVTPSFLDKSNTNSFSCTECKAIGYMPDLVSGKCRTCQTNCNKCIYKVGQTDISNQMIIDPQSLYNDPFQSLIQQNLYSMIQCSKCNDQYYMTLKDNICLQCPEQCAICTQNSINYQNVIQCQACKSLQFGTILGNNNLGGATRDFYFLGYLFQEYKSNNNALTQQKVDLAVNKITQEIQGEMVSVLDSSNNICRICPISCNDCTHLDPTTQTRKYSFLDAYNSVCDSNQCKTGFTYDKYQGKCKKCSDQSQVTQTSICNLKKIINIQLDCKKSGRFYDSSNDVTYVGDFQNLYDELQSYIEFDPLINFNERSIDELYISIISKNTMICKYTTLSLQQKLLINPDFTGTIFSLQMGELEFKTDNLNERLVISGYSEILFQGFQKVTLQNIDFDFDFSKTGLEYKIFNYTLNFVGVKTVVLNSVKIFGFDATQQIVNIYPYFNFDQAIQVSFIDVTIQGIKISQVLNKYKIYYTIFNLNKVQEFVFTNLIIQNLKLSDYSVFQNQLSPLIQFTGSNLQFLNLDLQTIRIFDFIQISTDNVIGINKILNINDIKFDQIQAKALTIIQLNFFSQVQLTQVLIQNSQFSNIFTLGFTYALFISDIFKISNIRIKVVSLDSISLFKNYIEFDQSKPLYEISNFIMITITIKNMINPILFDIQDFTEGTALTSQMILNNLDFQYFTGDNLNKDSIPWLFYIKNFGKIIINTAYLFEIQFLNLLKALYGQEISITQFTQKTCSVSKFFKFSNLELEQIGKLDFNKFFISSLNLKQAFLMYSQFTSEDNVVSKMNFTTIESSRIIIDSGDTDESSFFIIRSLQTFQIGIKSLNIYETVLKKKDSFLFIDSSSVFLIDSITSQIWLEQSQFQFCTVRLFIFTLDTIYIDKSYFFSSKIIFSSGLQLDIQTYYKDILLLGGLAYFYSINSIYLWNSNFTDNYAYLSSIFVVNFNQKSIQTKNIFESKNNQFARNFVTSGNILFQFSHRNPYLTIISFKNDKFEALQTLFGSIISSDSNLVEANFTFDQCIFINIRCNSTCIIDNQARINISIMNSIFTLLGQSYIQQNDTSAIIKAKKGFLVNQFQEFYIIQSNFSYIDSYNHIITSQISNKLLVISNSNFWNITLFQASVLYSEQTGKISINNITIQNIKFKNDYFGKQDSQFLLKSTRRLQIKSNITLTNSNFSTLMILNSQSLVIQGSNFAFIDCLICNGPSLYIDKSQFNVSGNKFSQINGLTGGSVFISNSNGNIQKNDYNDISASQNGGCIYLTNTNIIIKQEIFTKCRSMNLGGAIFSDLSSQSQSNVQVDNCTFVQNQALSGPTISYWGKKVVEQNILLRDNQALIYGSKTSTYPRKIKVAEGLHQSAINLDIFIDPVFFKINSQRSGGNLTNLTIILIDENNEFMSGYQTQPNENLMILFKNNGISVGGQSTFIFNQGRTFIQDLQLFATPGTTQQLILYSNAVYIPQSDGYTFSNSYSTYITIEFRKCIRGEIYINESQSCIACQKDFYTLEFGGINCLPCPEGGKCPGGFQIDLLSGYWRKDIYSDKISQCDAKGNDLCNEGFQNNTCKEGHDGALCESCDYRGILWNESYIKPKDLECLKCSETQGQLGYMIMIAILIVISVLISIKGVYNDAKGSLFQKLSQYFPFYQAVFGDKKVSDMEDETNIYIKLLFNYFSMVSIISTIVDDQELFNKVFNFPTVAFTPSISIIPYIVCKVLGSMDGVPEMYIGIIANIWIGIGILLIFVMCFSLIIFLRLINPKYFLDIMNSGFIFIFLYIQPSMISLLIDTFTCKEAGLEQYVIADMSMICYSDVHTKALLKIGFPILLLVLFLIPLIIFLQIFKSRHLLNKFRNKLRFGFLVDEYRENRYYWEFIRMYLRVYIVLIAKLLVRYQKEKAILIIIGIFVYFTISLTLKPFDYLGHNKIDQLSCLICIFSIINALFILGNPFNFLLMISMIVLYIINGLFVMLCIYKILFSLQGFLLSKVTQYAYKLKDIKFIKNIPSIKKIWVSYYWHKFYDRIRSKQIIFSKRNSPINKQKGYQERITKFQSQNVEFGDIIFETMRSSQESQQLKDVL